jgi:hypothetical protein
LISSSIICWARPPGTLERTPPLAAILITSTPKEIWLRTARRQSSAPLQVLMSRSAAISARSRLAPLRGSPWPPETEMPVPPRRWSAGEHAAFDRVAQVVTRRGSLPRSRTVVKPASSVRLACICAVKARSS